MRFIAKVNSLKPEFVFLLFATVFGLTFLFLTPPFQTPDEINHFYRAYQISEGNFTSVKVNNRVGGSIPLSIVEITKPYRRLPGNMHEKTNFKTVKSISLIPLNRHEKVFVDFPNTSMYSFISYLPQAISIFFLRILDMNPLFLFYGARLSALFFWIFSMVIAIRIIPVYKWLLVLLALLPMSLFIHMSLSADVLTNVFSFLFISIVFKFSYSEMPMTMKQLIFIVILTIALASVKLVYTPLIILLIILPADKFPFKKKYFRFIYFTLIMVLALLILTFWTVTMNQLYTPYGQYNELFRDSATLINGADMNLQLEYILSHKAYLGKVMLNSMIHTFDMYFEGYIGTFGWLDTTLPLWFIYLSYFILIGISFFESNLKIRISFIHKLVFILTVIVTIFLILLTQHLTWDVVGGEIIGTIQGRYFIPIFPLLFMLFYNQKFKFSNYTIPFILLYLSVSLFITTESIYKRYYTPSGFTTKSIACDAEKIYNDHFFETNAGGEYFGNALTQSDEKKKSGFFSSKLTSQNMFGFTYYWENGKMGDVIEAEVWRFGNKGGIIVDGPNNTFYYGTDKPVEIDSNGWQRIALMYTITKNIIPNKVSIYLLYTGNDSVYFDDFNLKYHEFHR